MHQKQRISGEARTGIAWWTNVLQHPPNRSITATMHDVIYAWSDAPSTTCLGGFYLDQSQAHPEQGSAFIIPIPHSLAIGREHFNTQERQVVEQVPLHWGSLWKGKSLLIHVNNKAVAHGISNMTIRGASMQVLRRCLLLASEYDLDLEAK